MTKVSIADWDSVIAVEVLRPEEVFALGLEPSRLLVSLGIRTEILNFGM